MFGGVFLSFFLCDILHVVYWHSLTPPPPSPQARSSKPSVGSAVHALAARQALVRSVQSPSTLRRPGAPASATPSSAGTRDRSRSRGPRDDASSARRGAPSPVSHDYDTASRYTPSVASRDVGGNDQRPCARLGCVLGCACVLCVCARPPPVAAIAALQRCSPTATASDVHAYVAVWLHMVLCCTGQFLV